MSFVKCSGCGEQIAIPAELYPEPVNGEILLNEPYYCDACEWEAETDADIDTTEYCSHCGKDVEDWSDLGCEYCDRRHPLYGFIYD